MSFTRQRRIAALALGALMSACSGDSSVGPSSGKPTDLNQVLAEMSLPALSGVAVSLAPTRVERNNHRGRAHEDDGEGNAHVARHHAHHR